MADRVWSLGIIVLPSGSCNSNTCMKLSFEEAEMSIHVCERIAFSAGPTVAISREMACEPPAAGGQCGPKISEATSRGASHELRYVREADGMAEPRACVHEDACPSRGSDLRPAGCRGSALEGDPD